MSSAYDPFDGFVQHHAAPPPAPNQEVLVRTGAETKALIRTDLANGDPPPSRKEVEEARTEMAFDARAALLDLLEVASSAHYAMADSVILLEGARLSCLDLLRARTALQAKCESIRSALGPRVHVLKADPVPFGAVWAGIKKYEVRKFDRDFRVGDELKLVEFDRGTARYSGAKVRARITTITKPGEWGLPLDVGVLGIEVIEKAEA